jgi:hypothetical protein
MGGHLDDVVIGRASELHARVDELHLSDPGQADTAYTFGATPSVNTACDTLKKKLIAGYGAAVRLARIRSTTAPTTFWLRRRSGSTCTDYTTWQQDWIDVKGG